MQHVHAQHGPMTHIQHGPMTHIQHGPMTRRGGRAGGQHLLVRLHQRQVHCRADGPREGGALVEERLEAVYGQLREGGELHGARLGRPQDGLEPQPACSSSSSSRGGCGHGAQGAFARRHDGRPWLPRPPLPQRTYLPHTGWGGGGQQASHSATPTPSRRTPLPSRRGIACMNACVGYEGMQGTSRESLLTCSMQHSAWCVRSCTLPCTAAVHVPHAHQASSTAVR